MSGKGERDIWEKERYLMKEREWEERERRIDKRWVCVCTCVCTCVCVCVCKRESEGLIKGEYVCVFVCVREREREKEIIGKDR